MSTFDGFINEIPNISIDCFEDENRKSKLFFLSHCHTDHMRGLYDADLPGPLYLSPVSSVIIRRRYPNMKNIIPLDVGAPTQIYYKINDDDGNNEEIVVTTLPAAHCPGSVMFLFEQKSKKILYTGDFRLSLKHIKKLDSLKSIHLDALYIDSTFLNKEYLNFPSQFESNEVICQLISEWLSGNDENHIVLKTAARYGYECLFESISTKLKQKIHINSSELLLFQSIPELDNCFTTDCSKCRIHACFTSIYEAGDCQLVTNYNNIRTIKPSAMIWTKWSTNQEIYEKSSNFYRVCYSNHSGLNEIRDLILYLKPEAVCLNVVPTNVDERRKMMETLNEILVKYQEKKVKVAEELDDESIQFNNIRVVERNSQRSIELADILREDNDLIDKTIHPIKRRRKIT